jgi:hypothetical protein
MYSRCFFTKEGDLTAFFSGLQQRLGPEIEHIGFLASSTHLKSPTNNLETNKQTIPTQMECPTFMTWDVATK